MAGLLGLAALVAPEAHVAPREATAWTWMLEVCASYLETGARAVFDNGPPDGEQVARPEGGLCNGDPACETAVMTFIGGGAAAQGTVTVIAFAKGLQDRPVAAMCGPALDTGLAGQAVASAQADWLDAADRAGRLVTHAVEVLAGCAWDGRLWTLKIGDTYAGEPHFFAELTPDALPCAAASS